MKEKITGFHKDDDEHWVAELDCGHNQHMRHDPPLVTREWVLTKEGRAYAQCFRDTGRREHQYLCQETADGVNFAARDCPGKLFMSIRYNEQQNRQAAANVRRARIPSDLTYETMSELGRDLFAISRDYAESGGELLSEQEIEVEVTRRLH